MWQDGGFYSAEDADSYPTADAKHKKEGAFCAWTQKEITTLLAQPIGAGSEKTMAELFCHHYGVEENGNVKPYQVGVHAFLGVGSINFAFYYNVRVS